MVADAPGFVVKWRAHVGAHCNNVTDGVAIWGYESNRLTQMSRCSCAKKGSLRATLSRTLIRLHRLRCP